MAFARFKTLFSTKFDSVIPPGDIYLTIPQLNKKYPDEMETITSNIYEFFFCLLVHFVKNIFLKDYSIRILQNDEKLAKNYREKYYSHRRLGKHLDQKKIV